MEVFRISVIKHAKTPLTASGKMARWNKDGESVLYTSHSRALATLEWIVKRASIVPSIKYRAMVIHIDDDYSRLRIQEEELFTDWQLASSYKKLQNKGSAWYKKSEKLVLEVPSAIVPMEYNFIINTQHPDFTSKVRLIKTEDYTFDHRLLGP